MQLDSSLVSDRELTSRGTNVPDSAKSPYPWFAVRTRSNCEEVAATALENKGLTSYLPTYRTRRRWSDRIVVNNTPLFRGYVFCRFCPSHRLPVLTAAGVSAIVGFGPEPAAIDDGEIEAIETVLRSDLATEPCPFLREGQSVRVIRGALTGVEGLLIQKKSDFRLVISVTMLQRSLSVEIERDWLKVI